MVVFAFLCQTSRYLVHFDVKAGPSPLFQFILQEGLRPILKFFFITLDVIDVGTCALLGHILKRE